MNKNYISSNKNTLLSLKPSGAIRLFLMVLFVCLFASNTVVTAQIAQRGNATNTSTNSSLTIDKPAGLVEGDIMFANIVQSDNDNRTLANATLTGWTLVAGEEFGNVVDDSWWGTILYKVATSTDVAATDFTFTGDNDADDMVGGIVAFSGVAVTGGVSGGPFDVVPGTINNINTDDFSATAITTVTNNAAVIMFGMIGDNRNIDSWTATSPATLTELFDIPFDADADMGVSVAWGTRTPAGSTGTGLGELSANENDPNGAILIALRPCTANPTITTSGTATSVCFSTSAQTTTLPYTATTNSPRSYSIDWDAAANAAGLGDQTSTSHTFLSGAGNMPNIAIPASLASATYDGTLTIVTSGGCRNTKAISVTVTTNTAGTASSSPTLCINTAISPNITIATTGATGIGTATGLPAGVTATWASNTITISGTPTASGTFNYSIPLTGGCGSVNATGTITVTPVTITTDAGILSGNQYICSYTSNTTTFSSTVLGGTWSTSNASIATVNSSTGVVTGIGLGTATITYTIASAGCSIRTATRVVYVASGPGAGPLSVNGSITQCRGATTTYSIVPDTYSYDYNWTYDGTGVTVTVAPDKLSATFTFGAAATGGNVVVSSTNGCGSAGGKYLYITVPYWDAGGTITGGTVSGGTTICSGSTSTLLTLSGNSGTITKWQSSVSPFTLWTDIVNTAATYTSGALTTTTQFRAVVQSGSCIANSATATVTVSPNKTASAASSTPTLCINTALTNITHTTTGATGIGSATGLPAGVTATWATNTLTISGTPTASGTFNYSIPLTGGCGAVNATGTITVTPANTAGTASSNPTLCINTVLTNITRTTTGATGIGTPTNLPAGVTAAFTTNTITISGTPTASGTFNYSIPLTGGCGEVNATGTITVTPSNTAGTASSNPTLCINTVLTNIIRTTTGATGIGTPTNLPAGVTAAFASNTITISGTPTASGTFNYSIPLTGGCGAVNATGTITVNATPTTANAGANQSKCDTATFTLAGNSPTTGTGIWTVVSGTATITTPTSRTSGVTGVPAGTSATLRWTISNGVCTASTDEVILTNNATPTTANAGANQSKCDTATFTLAGNSPTTGTGIWTVVSGTATITTPTSNISGVTGITAGNSATLRWTISNGVCTASTDEVILTNNATPTTANAGVDQANCNTTTFTLAGNSPTTGTGIWTVVSGTATITTPTSRTSGVTGVPAGTSATLRWTISNGVCTASTDEVILTNNATPTTANAGANQSKCDTATFTLAGNSPTTGTGIWTVVSGTATITTPTSNSSGVTGITAGNSATLRWTISNGACTLTDDVILTNNVNPTVASATSSTPICIGGNTTLSASTTPATQNTVLLYESFNGATNTWTKTNNSTGGTQANAAWTLQPDGYSYFWGNPFPTYTFSSNDSSQFYLTNSAAQNSNSGPTATLLVSPSMNTMGYTSLSLEFYQFYLDYDGTDGAKVEVSTNGTAWTPLSNTTTTQGSQNNFLKTTINLNAYINNSSLYIRFKYDAQFDWFWAIDNVTVSGNKTIDYTYSWSVLPSGTAGLPSGSVTASTANNSIVANPSLTTAYTVTATNPNTGCVSTSTINVNVNTSNTWTGTTNSSWFTASNWSCGSVPIAASDVTIPNVIRKPIVDGISTTALANTITVSASSSLTVNSDNTLKVTDKVTNSGGTITFEDSASLVQTNTVTNTGNIIYKRNYTGEEKDYTYWSSPVASQNLLALSPSTKLDKFFSFNGTDWAQENPSATTMTIGKGYIIRGIPPPAGPPVGFGTLLFNGVPNNGDKSITVVGGESSNLIGNPYPSAIYADKLLFDNKAVIDGTIYFWTHNTPIAIGTPDPGTGAWAYSGNDYAAYSLTGGVGTGSGTVAKSGSTKPTGFIAAGQSFFTTSTVSGGTVTFTNAMRVNGSGNPLSNSNFYKTKSPINKTDNTLEKNRIWLNLTNKQGAFKQTLVGYITGASNTWDKLYDGESFDGNDFLDFYSINEDKNLTIQGRALPFDENDEIPLGYRIAVEGTFTIKIDETDGLLANQPVFLEDKLTNTIFDLKSGNYTFNTTAGTFDDRFVLKYTNKTLAVDAMDKEDGILVLYSKNYNTLIIHNNMMDSTVNTVTLYNTTGQKISYWDVEDSGQTNIQIPINNMSSGIYIVKVNTTKGESSKKIIVN